MLIYCSKNQLDPVYPIIYVDSLRGMPSLNFPDKNLFGIFAFRRNFTRELLLLYSTNETVFSWKTVLNELYIRGLKDIKLIIHSNIKGLNSEVGQIYTNTDFQFSINDVKTRLFELVTSNHRLELAESIGSVFTSDRIDDTYHQGWERWQRFCEQWEKKYSEFGILANQDIYKFCFTYLKYDKKVWEPLVKISRIDPLQSTSNGSLTIWRPGENHLSYIQRLSTMFNSEKTKMISDKQLLRHDLGVLMNMPPQKVISTETDEKKHIREKIYSVGSAFKKHLKLA